MTNNSTAHHLAYMTVGGFLFAMAVMIALSFLHTAAFTTDMIALIGTMIGYLSAKSELVLAYYFGSSKGSERKTEILSGRIE